MVSGPCTTAVVDGRFCVGRWPGGYGPNEYCKIAVAGGSGGVLGGCPVFDTVGSQDWLALPGGSRHSGADCPAGSALAAGQTFEWHSSGHDQGNNGNGLPATDSGLGGGWQVCFA